MTADDATEDAVADALRRYRHRCTIAIIAAFDGDCDHAITFLTIWRHDRMRVGQDGVRDDLELRRLAAMLRRPYQTVRRRVLAMAGEALLSIRGDRIGIAAGAVARSRIATLDGAIGTAFAALRTDIAALGHDAPADLTAPDVLALELLLSAFDRAAPLYRTWLETVIIDATFVANQDSNDAQARTGSHVPVSVNRLSQTLGLPYAAVWRHVRRFIASGRLIEQRGRYCVSTEWLREPITAAIERDIVRDALAALTIPPPTADALTP